MCPGEAHGQCLLQPIGTVPRMKHYVSNSVFTPWKNSKLNILFLLFWHLKVKSCFYICIKGSQPYWISNTCQPCLFTNCISCQPYWFYNFIQLLQFNYEMKLKVDLWLDWSYFVSGMSQYILFPIGFNGKLETFKKKKILKACVCEWTLIIFQVDSSLTLPHVNFVFLKKRKKFFLVYFNTNNFEICSCQPCVTCVSHVEFLNLFLLSHVLTFNFNFNSNRYAWMWYGCWYAWLNFSFPYSNLFYTFWLHPPS